uniref:Putative S protein n=1 Tax=Maize chlorotic dwarf virus TaxID=51354 RepID=Q6EEL0_9SECO|nr:putative S protein [Maize chlorotic dwarf virus]WBO25599.1 putative S protein [Maize chlorotic dwarf virus]
MRLKEDWVTPIPLLGRSDTFCVDLYPETLEPSHVLE